MDDWLMIPKRTGKGRVVITFEDHPDLMVNGKPIKGIPFAKIAKAFEYRKPKTARIRPVFDPEAKTMGPWS